MLISYYLHRSAEINATIKKISSKFNDSVNFLNYLTDNLIYNSTNGLGMCVGVCVYPSLFESLLLLNALTDPNQIFCEGPNTQWLEIDGGGEAAPVPWAAQPPTKGRRAQPARWGSEAAPS